MRIFLASPFTQYLSPDLELASGLKELLVGLETALQDRGHSVFLAHRIEEFGAKLRPPHICAPLDLLEMRRCDAVIALPDRSFGVHVELGWASGLKKPTLILAENGEEPTSPMLTGLESVRGVEMRLTPPGLFTDLPVQEQVRALALEWVEKLEIEHTPTRSLAFVATAFGFGPGSKAATIAHAIRESDPNAQLHFFGKGIDSDLAEASGAFDCIIQADTDDRGEISSLLRHFSDYDGVVSVLNFHLPAVWTDAAPPLYLVDSLAWMWPELPADIDRADRYFVQDFMVSPERVQQWRTRTNLELVAPIDSSHVWAGSGPALAPSREDRLLVNLSGCHSPIASDDHFDRYATTMTDAIAHHADGLFEDIAISCNARLANRLRERIPRNSRIDIAHYPPREFLQLLARSRSVLSVPGITTTVEAIRLRAPIHFLLPQNYSQALISESYRLKLGDRATMALSRFGAEHAVAPGLPEADGMRQTVRSVKSIFDGQSILLGEALSEMLSDPSDDVVDVLKEQRIQDWDRPGQDEIAARILEDIDDAHATA
jgi:nucleoside 2-deoxyribosyltransferase